MADSKPSSSSKYILFENAAKTTRRILTPSAHKAIAMLENITQIDFNFFATSDSELVV